MSKYYLFQDTKKCIGCHSCEVACKSSKNLPVGPKLCEIITIGPVFIGGLPKAAYTFMPCFHCEDPWCVAACPTEALVSKRLWAWQMGMSFEDIRQFTGQSYLIRGREEEES